MSINFGREVGTSKTWFQDGKTIDEVVRKQVEAQIFTYEPDATLSIETHCFDVLLRSATCIMSFDVGRELWLNQSRWSRLIREYINAQRLREFIENAQLIYGGVEVRDGAIANMLFRDPEKRQKKHRWGGCLMAATFRRVPRRSPGVSKGILTFYSRTTYVGYMSFLDAAIAAVMAAHIGDPAKIRFRWHIGSAQLHGFKTLPYLYSQPDLFGRVRALRGRPKDDVPPTVHGLNSWQDRLERDFKRDGMKMLETERYGPYKRVKRRWLQSTGKVKTHIPPKLMVEDLSFDKASTEDDGTDSGEWFDDGE